MYFCFSFPKEKETKVEYALKSLDWLRIATIQKDFVIRIITFISYYFFSVIFLFVNFFKTERTSVKEVPNFSCRLKVILV